VSAIDDVARFEAGDEDAVVAAALMCPYCLQRPAQVLVNELADGADAMCVCADCKLQWSVALDPEQAMRLYTSPPRGLWIVRRFRGRS
jgi:hypothetical protein